VIVASLFSSSIEKSYLVDVKTKLYIATDSSPVDIHTYELCADLIDVVIDVSYIYGVKSVDAKTLDLGGGEITPYDERSASAIKLDNGMILYLREVSDYLALVCVIREEYFSKRALLDYNIDCLKSSLSKVIQVGYDNKNP
jgi:Ras-related GTP-binding protein C/D